MASPCLHTREATVLRLPCCMRSLLRCGLPLAAVRATFLTQTSRGRVPPLSQEMIRYRGRITEEIPKPRGHFRSRSPRRRYQDDYQDRDYRRQSQSSRERYEHDRYRDSDHRRRSRTRSVSPDYDRKHNRNSRSPAHRSPSHGKSHSPRRIPSRKGTPSRPRDGPSPRSGNP